MEKMNQHPPLRRLQNAARLLDGTPSREQRDAFREALRPWGVRQKVHGKKRPAAEVKLEFERKVLKEAVRLKALAQTGPHALSELREAFGRSRLR